MRRTRAELAAENAVLVHELEMVRNRLDQLLEEDDTEEASDEGTPMEESDDAQDED